MKDSKPILIGIILVLAVAVIYLMATRGGNSESKEYANGTESGQQTAKNEPQPTAPAETNATGTMSAKNFMQAQIPADLTDAQKTELAAGVADHKPTDLTFHVTGGSFFFAPNEIRVKQGDKVTIVFDNVGGMHNLILEAFKAQTKTIQGGESDTITFTANKKGTFEFYCGVGKGYHRMKGQIGVLLVE